MKVLILDHHELFRDGLKHLLQSLSGEVCEFLEAASFSEGWRCARRHPDLDLVLLELKSPGCIGVSPVKYFRKCYPHIPLLVVSGDDDSRFVNKALLNGASEFVSKRSSAEVFLEAVRRGLARSDEPIRRPLSRGHASIAFRLTRRELQVLNCLSGGMSNKEISATLGLSLGTVKAHVAAVYRELRVGSRIEAVHVASQFGCAKSSLTSW